jgi:CheY-like chemotaxis protein
MGAIIEAGISGFEVLFLLQSDMNASDDRKVILCVDDEVTGLCVRKMVLESQGYRVLTAENGPDALAQFTSNEIDLVVLDYSMPGMHGGVVAETMKGLRSTVPILLLSAFVDLPSETLALVDKYVTKGESPPLLLGAIAQLLSNERNNHSRERLGAM